MATELQHHRCPLCGPQLYNVPTINHVLHFLITVLTCGFWVFAWIWVALWKGRPRCGSCGLTSSAALRYVLKEQKQDVRRDHQAAVLEHNLRGPSVGERAKVTRGNHKGKFGTVTANDGNRVTIADKKGRLLTLPFADFKI